MVVRVRNGISVKTTGFRELEISLLELEKAATRKTVVRNALKAAAKPIADAMKSNATKTPDPRLQQAIMIGTKIKGEAGNAAYNKAMKEGFDKAAAVKAMRDARRAAKGTIPPVMLYVGPSADANMSHWWEFGIAPHINGGRFAGTRHPGVRPTPFIRPAWDSQKGLALDILAVEMRVQIDKAVKRQAKRKAKGA